MPKPITLPTIIDEVLRLNISKLKEWNYLNNKNFKQGVISWSRNGVEFSSIGIQSFSYLSVPYIELDYKSNGEPRNYKIYLVSKPSNLGKGVEWYFVCPKTHLLSRKLYLIGGYFFNRKAFNGCMYEKQTQTKKYRQIEKRFGNYFDRDKIYFELHKKHFKKTYSGKPTKKYLRLMNKLKQADSISIYELERAMMI